MIMEQAVMEKMDEKKMTNLPIRDPKNPSKKLSEKEEKFMREICTYEFINVEEPGLMHKFSYGNAQNKHTFVLFHGEKYRLPRFIQRHIESKGTPIWGWSPDGYGRMQKTKRGYKTRFQLREVYE